MDAGANLELRDRHKKKAVDYLQTKQTGMIIFFLRKNISLPFKEEVFVTKIKGLLHQACRQGALNLVQKLLKQGVQHSSLDQFGWTPLHHAADQGHFTICQILLQNGANHQLPTQDQLSQTPMILAIRGSHTKVISLLQAFKVGLSIKKRQELQQSLEQRDQQALKNSLQDLLFLLHLSSEQLDLELQSLLSIQQNNPSFSLHQTPLLLHNKNLLKILLTLGLNLNEQNDLGHTPLHIALSYNDYQLANLLIEHGADPNIQDDKGWAPLHYLARQNKLLFDNEEFSKKVKKTAQDLIDRGADLSLKNNQK